MLYPNIRILRILANLTQSEAASIFHVSQQTLSMVETGKREPSIPLLCSMADYYKVTVDYIIGRETNTK